MKNFKAIIILLNLVLLLVFFNLDVLKKEKVLDEGQLILLKLMPLDPRSLMQGDYMNLRYAISATNSDEEFSKRGYCIVKLDENGVAEKVRLQESVEPISSGEYAISYTTRKWHGINIGAESYFFQEGEGEKYEEAKYGGIKVDGNGNSLLIGLYDENRVLIE
ncbi:MAG: GDYXXLXY domain-containing protein [Bacteroidota bacterium]